MEALAYIYGFISVFTFVSCIYRNSLLKLRPVAHGAKKLETHRDEINKIKNQKPLCYIS